MASEGQNGKDIEQGRYHCQINGGRCNNPFTESTQTKSQTDNPKIAAKCKYNCFLEIDFKAKNFPQGDLSDAAPEVNV